MSVQKNRPTCWAFNLGLPVQIPVRGGPDDTGGGGVMGFFPVQTFFSAPNQKQTLFSSQAKEQADFFLHITPFFCQFCAKTFLFYNLLNKLFFHHFLLNNLFCPKIIIPFPPPTRRPIIWPRSLKSHFFLTAWQKFWRSCLNEMGNQIRLAN